jgi:hypothetical protein
MEISRRQQIGTSLRVHCPRCENPVEKEFVLKTGEYGACPWDECDAILAHKVEIETTAVDTKDDAQEVYEWIHDAFGGALNNE